MGRIVGFEPTTAGATDRCSTAELYPPCRTTILAERHPLTLPAWNSTYFGPFARRRLVFQLQITDYGNYKSGVSVLCVGFSASASGAAKG